MNLNAIQRVEHDRGKIKTGQRWVSEGSKLFWGERILTL